MKIVVCDDYRKMSCVAADILAEQIKNKPNSVIGLPTGSTPVGMYDRLVEMYNNGEVDFSEVSTFNLDEYYPISPDNDQSYRYFMNYHLFDRINIDKSRTRVPNGMAKDAELECAKYEEELLASGGVDIQVLGIGQNGHIGFNEPGANLYTATHITELTDNTIEANSRFFASKDDVPTRALTMGMASILRAKKIILLANGRNKAMAVAELLKGKINTQYPATLLNIHSDIVLICDKEAYAEMAIGVDLGGTNIKFGVTDNMGALIYKDSIATPKNCDADEIVDAIAVKCSEIAKMYPVCNIGIGTPGHINFKNRTVTATNLPFKDFPLSRKIELKTGIPVVMNNDANCAALGEYVAGDGKDIENIVMVTLGTGIGGGIIIGGKIYVGKGDAGEIGHICVEPRGKQCGCGRIGCWEKYASAIALEEMTAEAVKNNADSVLANVAKGNGIDGRTVFDGVKAGCPIAKKVLDTYTEYLALGIDNVITAFSPDTVIIAGGISAAGDMLLNPIKEKMRTNVEIKISKIGNDAGVIGAAHLCVE